MSILLNPGQSRLATLMQWVVSKLPRRLKRIMFIGMMLGFFSKKETPDQDLIRRINDTFKTADSPKAYELPIAVKSIIWRDFNLGGIEIETTRIGTVEVLTSQCKAKICRHISTTLPDWIRYASNGRIYRDTMDILSALESKGGKKIIPIIPI